MRIPVMNSARTSRNFVLLNIDSNRKMFNPKTTKILPLSGWNRNIAANEWIRNRVKNYIDIAIALKETKTSSRSVAIIGVDMADNVFNKIYEFNLTKKDSNKLAIKVTNSAIDDVYSNSFYKFIEKIPILRTFFRKTICKNLIISLKDNLINMAEEINNVKNQGGNIYDYIKSISV